MSPKIDSRQNGDSDGADYLAWQRNFGGAAASLTAMSMLAQVGEPGFDPAIGVVAESSSSSPPPIDDPLDVAGMLAVGWLGLLRRSRVAFDKATKPF